MNMDLTPQEVNLITSLRACVAAGTQAFLNGDSLPVETQAAPQHPQPRQSPPQGHANAGNGHQNNQRSNAPLCPNCDGPMYDERRSKYWNNGLSQNGKQKPIYKCRDSNCGGVIWPPKDNHRTPEQQAAFDAIDTGPHTPNFADNRHRAVAPLAREYDEDNSGYFPPN